MRSTLRETDRERRFQTGCRRRAPRASAAHLKTVRSSGLPSSGEMNFICLVTSPTPTISQRLSPHSSRSACRSSPFPLPSRVVRSIPLSIIQSFRLERIQVQMEKEKAVERGARLVGVGKQLVGVQRVRRGVVGSFISGRPRLVRLAACFRQQRSPQATSQLRSGKCASIGFPVSSPGMHARLSQMFPPETCQRGPRDSSRGASRLSRASRP